MAKFRIKAEVTERQTGSKQTATGTCSADSEKSAWFGTHKTLTRNGYNVGDLKVEQED